MATVTPYLMVESARPFIDFVSTTFGARVGDVVPLPGDTERIIHAEADLGDGVLYFADAGPDGGQCQRFPVEPAHLQLWITDPDPDETYARAVAGGAIPAMEMTDQEDGTRAGGVVAFGVLWWLSTAA